jgi:hypothetical protein
MDWYPTSDDTLPVLASMPDGACLALERLSRTRTASSEATSVLDAIVVGTSVRVELGGDSWIHAAQA